MKNIPDSFFANQIEKIGILNEYRSCVDSLQEFYNKLKVCKYCFSINGIGCCDKNHYEYNRSINLFVENNRDKIIKVEFLPKVFGKTIPSDQKKCDMLLLDGCALAKYQMKPPICAVHNCYNTLLNDLFDLDFNPAEIKLELKNVLNALSLREADECASIFKEHISQLINKYQNSGLFAQIVFKIIFKRAIKNYFRKRASQIQLNHA